MELKRNITISKLLRTPEQNEFFRTHTLIYGLYNNNFVESIIPCHNWDTEEGLDKITSDLSNMKLRCRFNTHRDLKIFTKWIKNDDLKRLTSSSLNSEWIRKEEILKLKSL